MTCLYINRPLRAFYVIFLVSWTRNVLPSSSHYDALVYGCERGGKIVLADWRKMAQ